MRMQLFKRVSHVLTCRHVHDAGRVPENGSRRTVCSQRIGKTSSRCCSRSCFKSAQPRANTKPSCTSTLIFCITASEVLPPSSGIVFQSCGFRCAIRVWRGSDSGSLGWCGCAHRHRLLSGILQVLWSFALVLCHRAFHSVLHESSANPASTLPDSANAIMQLVQQWAADGVIDATLLQDLVLHVPATMVPMKFAPRPSLAPPPRHTALAPGLSQPPRLPGESAR
jgi:hypothetical protein